jgi:hypothetical protein
MSLVCPDRLRCSKNFGGLATEQAERADALFEDV